MTHDEQPHTVDLEVEADLEDVWAMLSAVYGREVLSSSGPRFARAAEWLLAYKRKLLATAMQPTVPIRADSSVPEGEVHVYQDGKITGKIVGLPAAGDEP